MTAARQASIMPFHGVLRSVFERARATIFGDRVALYVVSLTDSQGFAVALAVHAQVAGPDPALLRERSQQAGVRNPLMVGSAPVEILARVAEALRFAKSEEGPFLGWAVREVHRAGGVPVLMVMDGVAVVSTFACVMEGGDEDELHGWTRPFVGEA